MLTQAAVDGVRSRTGSSPCRCGSGDGAPAPAQIDLRIASMMAAVRSGGSMCAHSRSMTSA